MNHYYNKPQLQLIDEIESLKNRIEELEQAEVKFKQSEKALRESEERLSKAQEVAKIGSWEMDITTEEAVWSDETYRLFGLEPQEFKMTFEKLKDFLYPEDRETVLSEVGEAMTNKDSYEGVYRIVRRDNEVRFIHSIAAIEHDESGKPVLIHGTVQDITERKQAESQLNESKRMLNDVLNTIPVRVFWKDLDGVYLGCNQLFAKDAGRSNPEELIGDNDYNMGWAEQADLYRSDDRSVIESGQPKINYKEPQTTPVGDIIWLSTSKIPLRNSSGNVYGVLGTYEDITERMQVESSLKGSEERFSAITEQSAEGITVATHEGDYVFVNPAFCKMMGYSKEELLKMNVFDMKEDKGEEGRKGFIKSKTNKDGAIIEVVLQRKDKSTFTSEVTRKPINIGDKNLVLGLVKDITERKQAEEVLRENEEKLRNIVEYSTNLFYSHTPDHVLTYISPQTREFFDCEPEEALIRWTEFVTDNPINDKGLKFTEEAIKTGERQPVYEFELVGMKGRKIWVEVSEAPIVENGKTVAIVGALTDITERKQAEDTLREKDSQYRLLIETSTAGINLLDKDGNFLVVNEPAAKDWGKRPVDFINKNVKEVLPPEFADEVLNIIQKVSETGMGFEREKFIEPLNKHFIGNIQPIFDDKKKFLGVQVMTFDITERKQAEQNIRDSEYLLRESQKVANLGSYVLDILGGIWKSSAILDDVFGIDKKHNKDMRGWLEVIHPEDQAMMQDYFAINVLINHESFNKEYRIKRINDQQERWVHGLGELEFNDDGNPIKLIGTIQDITDRKQSEMALQKSEESLKLAQEFGKVGSWDWDILNNKLTWSDQSFIQLGLKPNEIEPTIEILENFIHPDDRGLVSAAIEQTLKYDKPYSVETRMIKPDGKEWIMHTKGKVIRDENGNPNRFVGVQQDITERKLAEARVAGLANVLETSLNEIYIYDAETLHFTQVNEGARNNLGYSLNELNKLTPLNIKSELNKKSFEKLIEPLRSGKKNIINFQTVHKRKDGSIYPIDAHLQLTKLEDRPVFVAIILDISERKKAEEEIRNLSHSVEQSPAIVMITDISGNIEYVNPKFEEVTGYTAKEVFGKNPSILKSGETSLGEYEILWKTIKAGGEWHGEFHNRKKNGELYWESASISAIKDTKGQTTHYIAIKEDITERKAMDKRLRESRNRLRSFAERLQMIREEERATIAREIHDDLGQSLTALKMDISWVKNNPEMSVEAKTAKFDMMLDIINSTIQTVKRIATELRPGILDDLGLIPAIEWQATEFQSRFKIQCNVSINKSDVIIKDEISIAVFRIFQETLTNVARHSGATKVDIKLNFHDDNKLIMEIADNGVGIDEEQINSPKSLGLFGMRERVNILNGEMEITGEHGKGTKVGVFIPVSIEEVGNN